MSDNVIPFPLRNELKGTTAISRIIRFADGVEDPNLQDLSKLRREVELTFKERYGDSALAQHLAQSSDAPKTPQEWRASGMRLARWLAVARHVRPQY